MISGASRECSKITKRSMVTWWRGGKLRLPHEDRNTKKTCFLPNQKPRPTQACSSRTPPPALHERNFYILNEPNHMEWDLQLRLQSVVIFDSRPPIALRGSLIRAAALQHTGSLTSELVCIPYTCVCGRWCGPATYSSSSSRYRTPDGES